MSRRWLAASSLLCVLYTTPARAELSLSIAPAVLDLKIAPGETGTGYIYVTNKAPHPMYIGAEVFDQVFRPDGSRQSVPAGAIPKTKSAKEYDSLDSQHSRSHPRSIPPWRWNLFLGEKGIADVHWEIAFAGEVGSEQ